MSLDTLKLENSLCRCCHSDGKHKNLAEPWEHLGQQEIFSDMLQECLNIRITSVPGPLCTLTYTICEDCILRLREACNFKQQVIKCEEQFYKLYAQNAIKLGSSFSEWMDVKEEKAVDNDEEEDVKPDICTFQVEDDMDFDHDGDDRDYNMDSDIVHEQKSQTKKVKTKEKRKGKPKGRPRKYPAKAKEKDVDQEKKGVGQTAPKFHLRKTDYTTVGDLFKCNKCDKPYVKLSSLRYHVKSKHHDLPRYICPYCSEGFKTPAPLTVHKLQEHNVDDRFKCNACKGIFNTRVQLRKHINNFHMLGERYKCEFCEYESFSFEGLYKHKVKHKTVKDYHCRFCRKAFLRKTTLDLHERIHTGDRRKVCGVCSKAFVQKASLNYHMAKYHPEVNF